MGEETSSFVWTPEEMDLPYYRRTRERQGMVPPTPATVERAALTWSSLAFDRTMFSSQRVNISSDKGVGFTNMKQVHLNTRL